MDFTVSCSVRTMPLKLKLQSAFEKNMVSMANLFMKKVQKQQAAKVMQRLTCAGTIIIYNGDK